LEKETSFSSEKHVLRIAMAAVMTAFVTVATFFIQIPNPPTRGYINIGDAMIFTTALTFGSYIGGMAGGLGSALADLWAGYAFFAPFTLVIKGCEGLVAGFISDRRTLARDILAVSIGGIIMILGYFAAEAFLLGYGLTAAATEVLGNTIQVFVGAVIGIPISTILRRRLPQLLRQ
jgi:uncharacterized membrane protein